MNEKIVSKLLLDCGIDPSFMGYDFIKTALSLIEKDPVECKRITKVLYPDIAKIHKTTPSKVEKGIRRSVEKMFLKENNTILKEVVMGYDADSRPTNREFLFCLAERLKWDGGGSDGLPVHLEQ